MAKYIDAEAMAYRLEKFADIETSHGRKKGLLHAAKLVSEQTAAAVEPVVHAHWVVDDEYLSCSHCGESYLAGDTRHEVQELLSRGEAYKRCPQCGARMNEETFHGKI